jgi:hypothetical protein
MARRDTRCVRLLTRRGYDWTQRFSLIADAIFGLRCRSCLIDDDVLPRRYRPWGSPAKVYDVVPAKADRAFRDFNMGIIHGQANTARCNVIGFTNRADRPTSFGERFDVSGFCEPLGNGSRTVSHPRRIVIGFILVAALGLAA